MTRQPLSIALFALLCAAPAYAQLVEPPARGIFGGVAPSPGRTRHELSTRGSLLGGWDDNLAVTGGGNSFEDRASGYTAFADAGLRYFVGRAAKSLDVNGRGFMNTFRNAGVGRSFGGEMNAAGSFTMGQRMGAVISQGVRYDPYFSLGAFSPLQVELGAANPDVSDINAVHKDRSWYSLTNASVYRNWTRSLRSDLSYAHSQVTYEEGFAYDSRSDVGNISVTQSLDRRSSIRGSYQYSDQRYLPVNRREIPMINQNLDAGYQYRRNLSRTRVLTLGAGGGASYVSAILDADVGRTEYWTPSGYGSVRLDLARSWSIAGDFRRSVTSLQGATPVFYNADTIALRTGGSITRRLSTALVAGYANGETDSQFRGKYEGYSGTAQLRMQVTRGWSANVVYNHYRYVLDEAARQAIVVSPALHRNAVVAGVNWNLPLIGALPANGGPQ